MEWIKEISSTRRSFNDYKLITYTLHIMHGYLIVENDQVNDMVTGAILIKIPFSYDYDQRYYYKANKKLTIEEMKLHLIQKYKEILLDELQDLEEIE